MIPTNKKVVTEQTSQNTNITNLQNNKVDKVSGKAFVNNSKLEVKKNIEKLKGGK